MEVPPEKEQGNTDHQHGRRARQVIPWQAVQRLDLNVEERAKSEYPVGQANDSGNVKGGNGTHKDKDCRCEYSRIGEPKGYLAENPEESKTVHLCGFLERRIHHTKGRR